MGRIATEAFSLTKPNYSTILALENTLQSWVANLPDFFTPIPYGQDYNYHEASLFIEHLIIHRYLLWTEYRFIRTTLHRPYLAKPGEAYAVSREACVASAMDDLWARMTAYPLRGMGSLSTGSYRVTLSIVVLG